MLHRFPHLTETFIVREMSWIRKHTVSIEIFSLLSPRPGLVHEDARALLPFAHYSAYLSREVISAQLHFLRLSPGRYFSAFWKAIRLSYQEPGLLLRTLVVFFKSVFFARQMQDKGVVHIHAHFAWLGAIASSVMAELLGITYTVHAHAFDLFTRNRKAVQALLEDTSGIVTISDYHRDYIASICPQRSSSDIIVVHCGLDADQFRPAHKRDSNAVPFILSVGSLNEKKGHEYLIDACALLAEHGVSFRCGIVGDSSARRRELLQTRINSKGLHSRVTLLGPMQQNQIIDCYRQSDIFALPCVVARGGDRDGIPVVLMEAMACELPVITTPIAGIPELVEDGITGLLVKERDAPGLATALERLITDKALGVKLGKQARRKVQADFTVQQSARKLASVFQRCDPCSGQQNEVECG